MVFVNLGCNWFPIFIYKWNFYAMDRKCESEISDFVPVYAFFWNCCWDGEVGGYVRSLVYAWNWLFLFYFPLIWNSLSTNLTNWLVLFILSSKVLFFLNRYFLTTYVLSDQITVSIFKYIGIQYFCDLLGTLSNYISITYVIFVCNF